MRTWRSRAIDYPDAIKAGKGKKSLTQKYEELFLGSNSWENWDPKVDPRQEIAPKNWEEKMSEGKKDKFAACFRKVMFKNFCLYPEASNFS